jgi:shikimate dehydrogenase
MDGQGSILSADAMRRAAEGRLKAVLDIVYRPDETPLVHAAREAGLRAEDGLGVLVHQGAETYRLFFGESVAVETLREAAWRAAGRGT